MSGRLLADITKALPAQPVEISVDGSRVTITCGSAKFSLPTMPVEDYPPLPAMPQRAGEVAGEVFGQAVAQVAVAAGRDDTLPMLTGVRVEIDGDKLTLVATDRFRLAMREFDLDRRRRRAGTAVLVPARTLADAAKTLGTAATRWRSRWPPATVCSAWPAPAGAPRAGCWMRSSRSTGSCCPASTRRPR